MKRNLIVSLIAILFMSSICFGASYIIHDYDTGIMHMAQDIYLNNTRNVQTEIESLEVNLGTTYSISLKADKAGTLSQFTGGTNLNQIATRNHDDLQNITGNGTVHLSASEKSNYDTAYSHSQNTTSAHGLTISDVALKSGSLSQFTTRNASDINVTATSYGRGLATTDIDLQKVSNRIDQNGTPQFVTDKTKCSLLLDFKGTLADKTRAINPIGSDAVNKWVDNYVNDSTSKEVATNISYTFKQFEGDEGLFGAGVAVEESRTNLLLQSDDLTSATWTKTNCTVTLDRILPDGRKLFKIVAMAAGDAFVYQPITTTNGVTYTASFYIIDNDSNITYSYITDKQDIVFLQNFIKQPKLNRVNGTVLSNGGTEISLGFYCLNAGATAYFTSPQLEAGAFPTSYIATGATAVTRPAGKVNYDPNLLNSKTDFTLSFWFKPNFNYDTSAYINLFFISNGSKVYTINYNGPVKQYSATLGAGYSMIGPVFSNNTQFQQWQHLVISKSGTNASFYFNNSKIDITNAETIADIALFLLGYSSGTNFCNGTISNFAIFNYALTEAEISQIYNSGLEGKPIAITNPENIIPVGQSLHDTNFVTFASGWGISSTYPNKPTIAKSSNVALMRGIIEYSGTVNTDVTIFTLPEGSRPSLPDTYYHSFVATARDSGSPAMRILRVYGNGDVVLMANGATITNPAVSLDNINFVNGK